MKKKITAKGESIVLSSGTLTSVTPYKDAYQLAITLENGKSVVGFRGQSLGEPALGPHQFYIKEVEFKAHGNTAWNIGFPEIDDFDPFA